MTAPPVDGGDGGAGVRQRRLASSRPVKQRVWLRVWLPGLLFLVAGVAAFLSLGRWVASGAAAPVPANVIVALGGDNGNRVTQSALLYRAGYAPFVMVTAVDIAPPPARAHYLEWRVHILADAGIPADKLVLDSTATNSFEEAAAALALMQARGWQTALVVSDPPHMRRLDWVWRKAFAGSDKRYILVASEPAWWDPDRWWMNEKSGQFVITEVIKLVYYAVKY